MRLKPVLSVVGLLLVVVGIAMLAALAVSWYYREGDTMPILYSSLITILSGALLLVLFKATGGEELRPREGFVIVTLGWVIIPAFGCLPFLFSGAIPSFTDAYFEAISGFTTTGASILTNVEVLPHGLLFWRSLTHWLGGMGIIVLSLAILPLLGTGGMQLFRAEVAGPTKDKLTPRIAETARLLWSVYVLITAAEVILLIFGGMPLFDAVCHSFATIASGGFSTKNASIGFFNSPYIDAVVTFFMFLAGTNFALHYAALKGNLKAHFRNDEFRFFLISYIVASVIVTAAIAGPSVHGNVLKAFRYSAFNVMSIMSCTGFATTDFALWVPIAQIVLLFLLFPGGCAGSTAGGMKNIRVLLLLRTATNELKKLIHPKLVTAVRNDGRAVEAEILFAIGGFIILYLATFAISAVVLAATGLDLVTSMSAVATCMAGCGPGLGTVGPASNYAHLSAMAKWVLDASMLLGRLEIYSVFVVFSSSFWKR
jgi:trk system potassium uptake protein TrkH